jgi:hypothetical protein
MTKRASGRELDPNLIPIVADLTEAQLQKARLNVAYRLERLPLATKKREVLEMLQACGLAPYEVAKGARVDPQTGQTIYPPSAESRRKAADRQAAYERRTKEAS